MTQAMDRRALFRGAAATSLLAVGAMAAPSVGATATGRPTAGSQLDPADVQLLFADLQTSLVGLSRTTPPRDLTLAAGVLAKVAVVLHIPATFSVVPEASGPAVLIPELRAYVTATNTYQRGPVSPFGDPPTVATLARARRRTLVIAGFATEAVVLHAALDALAAGYAVQYVVDACGGFAERTESAAFRHLERAGAIPTSVLSLTTRLAPDLSHSPGKEAFMAIGPLLGR